MQHITEGKARIVTKGAFFNPRMKELRDISVAFLKATGRNAKVLDSTAATGVRGIRYIREAGSKSVTFLDVNRQAFARLRHNLKLNGLKQKALNKSIQEFANTTHERFDVIDLDPFGTPQPYIFDLLKVSDDGTILMITATDTAVLCGAHPKACYKLYSAKPLHSEHCKEVGARILLSFVARVASQFNFGIEPLLTVSSQHYIRLFLRLNRGAEKAVESVESTGFGTFCWRCRSFSTQKGPAPRIDKMCQYCKIETESFGPLWLGILQDKKLLARIGRSTDSKIVEKIAAEFDTPLFYSIPRLTKSRRMGSVSHYGVIAGLKKKGFIATATQFDENGVKTNAGYSSVIHELVRKRTRPL